MAKNPLIAPEIRAAYAGESPPVLIQQRLAEPLRKRRSPAIIGVQLMGDLFLESVPDDFIYRIWSRMAECGEHIFLVLTKRPKRMKTWLYENRPYIEQAYSLDHIALGTTVENQQTADERILQLLLIDSKWHWISYEPALDPVDFYVSVYGSPRDSNGVPINQFLLSTGAYGWPDYCNIRNLNGTYGRYENGGINFVVAGCESGPNRRPSDPDWFRSVRDQCQASGTSFFLKQMDIDGRVVEMPKLDGQVWDQLPWRQNENQ